jgi:hypothetical protein
VNPTVVRRCCLLWLGLLSIEVGVRAQDGPAVERRPVLGRVVDGEGRSVADATVVAVRLPDPWDSSKEPADAVVATTDSRGRFRLSVLGDAAYCAWAAKQLESGGGNQVVLASEMSGPFGAGALPELRVRRSGPARTARPKGRSRWPDGGSFEWGVAPTAMLEPWFALPPAGEGELSLLPLLPASGGWWGVRDGDGQLLYAAPLPAGPECALELPPPDLLHVEVQDEAGLAVAGAEVRLRLLRQSDADIAGAEILRRWRSRPLGRTDERGVLQVQVPSTTGSAVGRRTCLFEVHAAGRARTVSGFDGAHVWRDDVREARGDRQVVLSVPAAVEPVRGRVVAGGSPARGVRVVCKALARMRTSRNSFLHDERYFEAVTDAEGRYEFDGIPADLHASKLWLQGGQNGQLVCELPMERGRPSSDRTHDLRLVVAASFGFLDVLRGPAAGQVVYLRPVGNDAIARRDVARICADHAGRAIVRLWAGEYFVCLPQPSGVCFARVQFGQQEQDMELVCRPYARCRGVLRDETGAAVAGARLVVQGIDTDQARLRDRPDERAMLYFVREPVLAALREVRTADDGTFDIAWPAVSGFDLKLQFVAAGRRTEVFAPAPGELELVAR